MKEYSDERLAASAAAGDKEAESELLERYKETVRAKARLYYIFGGDADDIMQEGMIGLFSAIGSFNPAKGASFKTFANLCINRRILSAVKKAQRLKHSPLNESLSLDFPAEEGDARTLGDILPADADTQPEASVLFNEMLKDILENKDRTFSELESKIISYLVKGYDYRRIAERLGRSPKSVDNAMQRIRQKLEKFLAE